MSIGSIICWWSGGVTSAVACKLAIEFFGIDSIRIIFLDTHNEHDDTYRFKEDCEKWYGIKVETASRIEYRAIEEVWYKYLSLNVANGAICSSELKRDLRIKILSETEYRYNIFGFDIDEPKRAKAMAKNWPDIMPIFPLLFKGLTKKDCIEILQEASIEIPETYKLGFNNNNCFKTGCIQGGIGYWQKIQREYPDKFERMAFIEHDLTNKKGQPVTILKDQSKFGGLVFLKPHPKYPLMKDISMMRGKGPEPLMECNGFCGTHDLITDAGNKNNPHTT